LNKESDLDKMSRFILKEYEHLKIDGRSNLGGAIVPKGKFGLRGDDKTKIRNMTVNIASLYLQLPSNVLRIINDQTT
jgi:hypothetical protein